MAAVDALGTAEEVVKAVEDMTRLIRNCATQGIRSWGLLGPQRTHLHYWHWLWEEGQELRYALHFHGEDGGVNWYKDWQ